MTASEIISKFELLVDDTTELATSEELDLLNKIYKKIFINRPWEFSKKTISGTITNGYITLPSDFAYLFPNYQYTDNSYSSQQNSSPTVIFTGNNNPVKVVNYSDRRQYNNQSGYAYIDLANSKIVFTATPSDTTYDFDYVFIPSNLGLSDSPNVPIGFMDSISQAIASGMSVEDTICQLFDKARSYAPENQAKYDSALRDMAYINARLLQN